MGWSEKENGRMEAADENRVSVPASTVDCIMVLVGERVWAGGRWKIKYSSFLW